jgi:hypothetical protein
VTGALPADASDMVVTPVNKRTLEEELLENLHLFDDCVLKEPHFTEMTSLVIVQHLPENYTRRTTSRGNRAFFYVDRAPTSGHRRNENDTTPLSELDKVRTVSNLRENSASENVAKSLVHSPAAPLSTEAGTVHRLGYTSQSAGGDFFSASEKQDNYT